MFKNLIPSNRIWLRFKSKQKNGNFINLRIQDMPKDRHNDVVQLILKYYIKEETMHIAAGVSTNKEAVKQYEIMLKETYKEGTCIIICCEDNDTDEVGPILGVSTMRLQTKQNDDSSDDFSDGWAKAEEMKKNEKILDALQPYEEVTKKYESYYDDLGLLVHPNYRGLGIAG